MDRKRQETQHFKIIIGIKANRHGASLPRTGVKAIVVGIVSSAVADFDRKIRRQGHLLLHGVTLQGLLHAGAYSGDNQVGVDKHG